MPAANGAKRKAEGLMASIRPFIQEFIKETDRAAIILGAAKLDSLLYLLLRKALKPNPTSADTLLDTECPLSSFSAKIDLAYRLGLIDNELARALHLIRKIRNAFAHELSGVSLDSGPQHDRLRELISPFEQMPYFLALATSIQEEGGKGSLSASFRAVLAIIVSGLEFRNIRQRCLADGKAEPLVDPILEKLEDKR